MSKDLFETLLVGAKTIAAGENCENEYQFGLFRDHSELLSELSPSNLICLVQKYIQFDVARRGKGDQHTCIEILSALLRENLKKNSERESERNLQWEKFRTDLQALLQNPEFEDEGTESEQFAISKWIARSLHESFDLVDLIDPTAFDAMIRKILSGRPPTVISFPIASVDGISPSDSIGQISTMALRVWEDTSPWITMDLDMFGWNTNEPCRTSAEDALAISEFNGGVTWRMDPRPKTESGNPLKIEDTSRSAAMARALWLHNNGEKVDARVLVLGAVDSEKLVPVTGIPQKTRAAIDYTKDEKRRKSKETGATRVPIDRIVVVGKKESQEARETIRSARAGGMIDVHCHEENPE